MKSSIGSDALKITASKVITMVISMLNAMLLSRTRTLQEYGVYSQLLLVINLITTAFMLGLPNSLNYFLANEENEEEKQKFLSVYYSFSTALGIFSGLVAVLITPILIDFFNNPLLNKYIYVLAIIPWTKIIMSSVEHILILYNKTNYLMVYRVLNSISLLAIIFAADQFNLTFHSYLVLFVIVEFIFMIAVYILVSKISRRLYIKFDKNIISRILKFSIPIGLASVVGTLSVELDKLIIARYFSTEELAIFTNAARELPVSIITSALTAVLLPHLVRLLKRNKNTEAIDLWGHTINISYIFIAIIAFGVFTFAPEVMTLLYSEKYLPGVTVFRIYTILLLLRPTYFGIVLNAIGKTEFIFYSSLVSLGLNVILNYLFYLLIGFNGPAIATLISVSAVQIIQLVVTSKIVDIPMRTIFPWRNLFVITVVNIIFSIIFYAIKQLINLDYAVGEVWESIILGMIWAGLYFTLFFKKIKYNWEIINNSN